MKSLFLALTLLGSVIMTDTYANDIQVSGTVLKSFESTFKNATDAKWSKAESLFKAAFSLNNQEFVAFFNERGTLVATTRYLTYNQLPLSLQLNLARYTKDHKVTEVFEVNNEEGSRFFVTVENATRKIVLASVTNTDWVKYKKTRK